MYCKINRLLSWLFRFCISCQADCLNARFLDGCFQLNQTLLLPSSDGQVGFFACQYKQTHQLLMVAVAMVTSSGVEINFLLS